MSLPFIRYQLSAIKLELLVLGVLLTAVALLQRDPMTAAQSVHYEDRTTQFLVYLLVVLGLLLPIRIFCNFAGVAVWLSARGLTRRQQFLSETGLGTHRCRPVIRVGRIAAGTWRQTACAAVIRVALVSNGSVAGSQRATRFFPVCLHSVLCNYSGADGHHVKAVHVSRISNRSRGHCRFNHPQPSPCTLPHESVDVDRVADPGDLRRYRLRIVDSERTTRPVRNHSCTPKAKGRNLLAFICVTTFLFPIALTLYTTAGEWERFVRWSGNPIFIGVAVVAGLLIVGAVWWKGAASSPEVILIPAGAFLICQSAGVFRYEAHSAQTETKPPAISVDSYDGTEVRCNGVLLGTTPLTITLDEFAQRVAPVDEPPVQEAAFVWSRSSTDSLAKINWSALPFDPFNPDSSRLGQTTDVVVKRFTASRYFWTFKIGKFQAARSGRSIFET